MTENYCIKPGYLSRNEEVFLNTETRTDEFQRPVYSFAKMVAQNFNLFKIADVGCGSAYKLLKIFFNYETVGYDLPKTVEWLKTRYPERDWRSVLDDYNADLVICADVIEHVLNPDDIIAAIKRMNPQHIIISTPNRDLHCSILGANPDGPPSNPHHIREWSCEEFKRYISKHFDVVSHVVIKEEFCQLIHCKPKA